MPPTPEAPNLFVGSVRLDEMNVHGSAREVFEEVIQHLANLPGVEVDVSLEIRAKAPRGIRDDIVRIVLENARTLKFDSHHFDKE